MRQSLKLASITTALTVWLLLQQYSNLYAQQDFRITTPDKMWMQAGFGMWGNVEASHQFSAAYNFGNSLITLRYLGTGEFISIASPAESTSDIGVLYGRTAKESFGILSLSAGIAYVHGVQRGRLIKSNPLVSEYETIKYSSVGIPIEGSIFWTPLSFIGIGVNGFANINSIKSFSGVQLCLRIGKLD